MANVVEITLQVRDQLATGFAKASKEVESFAGKLQAGTLSAKSLGLAMAGVGTVATAAAGAAAAFAVRMAEQVEQLSNLSAQTGINEQRLQTLQFAFRQGGVDAGALTQGLAFMTRALQDNGAALQRVGVTSRDPFEAFMQLSKAIANTKDVAARNALVFQAFGRGGAQLVPVLQQLATNFDAVDQAARRTGNRLSAEQIKKLQDLDAAVDHLTATLEGFGKRGVLAVAGPLEGLVGTVNKLVGAWTRFDSLSGSMRAFAETFMGAKASKPQNLPALLTTHELVDSVAAAIAAEAAAAKALALTDQKSFDYLLKRRAELAEKNRPIDFGSLAVGRVTDMREWSGLFSQSGPGNLTNFIGPQVEQAQLQLTEFGKHVLKVALEIERAFATIGDALGSGILSVFLNLTNRAQTFRSAIVTIFQSMVQGVLAAIGQIVAAEVTKIFLKILGAVLSFVMPAFGVPVVPGIPGEVPIPIGAVTPTSLPGSPVASLGAAAGESAFSVAAPSRVAGGYAVSPPANAATRQGGGDTFYITTLSAKGILEQLVSARGEFRRAQSRVFEVAAVS